MNDDGDSVTDCDEVGWQDGLADLWDLITGGEAETSDVDSTTDDSPGSNIQGPKGRMVRLMKRSVQERREKCTEKSVKIKKDREDLVRMV